MKSRFLPLLVLSLFINPLISQELYSEGQILELSDLAKVLQQKYDKNKLAAIKIAEERGMMIRYEDENGEIMEIQGLDEKGNLTYYVTDNLDAARTVSTDMVWPGGGLGYSLSGGGVNLGEWDGGGVRLSHRELTPRVTQIDVPSGTSDHATHVAGTMVATGVTPTAKGMAYTANLNAYDWNSDNSEMATAASNGMLISNHSYGTITGWRYNSGATRWEWWGDTTLSTSEDYKFGYYNFTARAWDQIAGAAPYYLIVKSSGNDRNDTHTGAHYLPLHGVNSSANRPDDGGASGYDCISTSGNAKNILTVGAVNAIPSGYSNPGDVVMSSFSGWGPTDDGRIKPDIVANGVGVYSSLATNDSAYASYNGTSMAAPNTAGSLALIQEHYNDEKGAYLKSASLKALLIHTADEAGPSPGPDYQFGWGLLNTASAVEHISQVNSNEELIETSLSNSQTYTFAVQSDGVTPLKATICWTDEAGTVPTPSVDPTNQILVNDLDLRVVRDSNSFSHEPYILNPASPASAATTGDNFRDNVEQVYIAAPANDIYTITVTHKGSLSSAQDFSLMITGGTIPTAAPSNDSCNNAISLQCGTPLTGTTIDATSDANAINCGTNVDAPGVWYQVVGNGQSMQVDLCGPATNYDTRLNVYSGTCSSLSCVTGNDNSCGNSSSVSWSSSLGITYYILVQGTSGAMGDFEIALNSSPSSGITPSSATTICEGDSVELVADAADTYQWLKDLALISGANSQSYFAKDSATYTVITIDANNCSDTNTTGVNVNMNPSPSVIINTSGPTTFCEGGNVIFSTPGGVTQHWLKDGDSIQFANSVLYNATESGVYNLIVTDTNGCSDTAASSVPVTVNPLPVVNITASGPTTICEGESVTLSTSGGVTYQWYFNNILISPATSPNFIASNTGNYNVVVQDANTCIDSASSPTMVTENAKPNVLISAAGSTTICDGDNVMLSTSTIGVNYQWYKDGTIIPSATTSSYTVSSAGNYNVEVENASSCSDTAASGIVISVNPLPTVTLNIIGANTICAGDSVELNATTAGSHQWYLNGNMISMATDSVFYAKVSGNYNAMVVDMNGCEDSASSGVQITVNPLPSASINPVPSNEFCTGDSIQLSTGSVGSLQWTRNGALIAGATSANVFAKSSGVYNVIVTSPNTCSDSSAMGISIIENPLPVISIVNNGDSVICEGDTAILVASGAANYQWYGDGAPLSTTTPQINIFNSGSYNVLGTDVNGCVDSASTPAVIVVNDLPTVSMDPIQNLCNTITSYNLTEGSPAGGVYSGTAVTGSTFNPQQAGIGIHTITYTYTDTSTTCTNSISVDVEVDNCIGIEETGKEASLVVFPVPTTDLLKVRIEQPFDQVKFQLLNLEGKVIRSRGQFSNKSSNVFQTDVDGLARGIYMLQIELDRELIYRKVVVQ